MTGHYIKYYRDQIEKLNDTNSFCLSIGVLKDLLDSAEYANKASYVLESMPVDLDEMLEGFDPNE